MSCKAEDWLASLDPIGWRFGLDRIQALLGELGEPQRSFESIHVVGTNGKSSVTVMSAALIEDSGRSTGVYLSPHSERWAERVRIGGAEVAADAFERAALAVAAATPVVEAGFEEGERITQFEAATAVAFVALAHAGVEVGVIEAGLGGRLDATNVLDSRVTVLTSIGLDHTAWLGETEAEIAAEKLAVLQPGSTLVVGRLSDEVEAQAREVASKLGCDIVRADAAAGSRAGMAPYLRRNLGVAIAAAEVITGRLSPEAVERSLTGLDLPGRFQLEPGDPPVVLDAAHNPDGAGALAEALREELGETPVVACLAILADKDAEGIVKALAPAVSAAVCTEIPASRLAGAGRPGTSAVQTAELVRICEAAGVPATANLDPARAIGLAVALARERGGVALVAGSHYLLGYRWTERRAQSSSG